MALEFKRAKREHEIQTNTESVVYRVASKEFRKACLQQLRAAARRAAYRPCLGHARALKHQVSIPAELFVTRIPQKTAHKNTG